VRLWRAITYLHFCFSFCWEMFTCTDEWARKLSIQFRAGVDLLLVRHKDLPHSHLRPTGLPLRCQSDGSPVTSYQACEFPRFPFYGRHSNLMSLRQPDARALHFISNMSSYIRALVGSACGIWHGGNLPAGTSAKHQAPVTRAEPRRCRECRVTRAQQVKPLYSEDRGANMTVVKYQYQYQ